MLARKAASSLAGAIAVQDRVEDALHQCDGRWTGSRVSHAARLVGCTAVETGACTLEAEVG